MFGERGHSPRRSVIKPSLLGDGLLERLRSTSLALLGLSASVGLILVAVALQQSWPLAPNLPIPVPPFEERLDGAQVVVSPAVTGKDRDTPDRRLASQAASPAESDRADRGGSGLANADSVAALPSQPSVPTEGVPVETDAPDPAPQEQPSPPSPPQSSDPGGSGPSLAVAPPTSSGGQQTSGTGGKSSKAAGEKKRMTPTRARAKGDPKKVSSPAKKKTPSAAKVDSDSKYAPPQSTKAEAKPESDYKPVASPAEVKDDKSTYAPVPPSKDKDYGDDKKDP